MNVFEKIRNNRKPLAVLAAAASTLLVAQSCGTSEGNQDQFGPLDSPHAKLHDAVSIPARGDTSGNFWQVKTYGEFPDGINYDQFLDDTSCGKMKLARFENEFGHIGFTCVSSEVFTAEQVPDALDNLNTSVVEANSSN